MKTIGERLKSLRESKKLEQKELASLFSVTPTTISRYEKAGEEKGRIPDADMLVLYADYFDVSVDYILGRVDHPQYIRKELSTEDGKKLTVVVDKNRSELRDDDYLRKLIQEELLKIHGREKIQES